MAQLPADPVAKSLQGVPTDLGLHPWDMVCTILVQCNKAVRYEYGIVGQRHVMAKLWRSPQVVSMNPVDTVPYCTTPVLYHGYRQGSRLSTLEWHSGAQDL